ncbi:hypothetical protein ACFQJ7_13250 [Halovenus rubra]|uniref:Uncharacterized protein n=2 Tax=Halovenus rubra TaxID=869890 RepID=A0ACC7DZZ7_9EURY|nr:hypothetical protein [Halovenus rubra]
MSVLTYDDKLEILGLLGGVFIILVALGTLLEPPWTTNGATGAAIVQTIGVFLSVAVGLVLIEITYGGGLRGLLPGGSSETET